jgi:hypothetical protein
LFKRTTEAEPEQGRPSFALAVQSQAERMRRARFALAFSAARLPNLRSIAGAFLFLTAFAGVAAAGEVSTFVYGVSSTRFGDASAIVLENRLRIEQNIGAGNTLTFRYKVDGIQDLAEGEGRGEIREAFATFSSRRWQIEAGRKTMTWGLGDLLFINDAFPKDYESFFAGRPMEYLKKPSDGLFVSYFGRGWSADFALTDLAKDTPPRPNRFRRLPNPFPSNADLRFDEEPNAEAALRIYGSLEAYDVAVYASTGRANQPGFRGALTVGPPSYLVFYPQLTTYGFSLQSPRWGGLLSLEAGIYDIQEDYAGTEPGIPNSETHILAGYQTELGTDFTAGAQYYAGILSDYAGYKERLLSGASPRDRIRQVATLRLTRLLNYQTVRLSLFAFYSPSDGDSMLIPEVSYTVRDDLTVTVGAHIISGSSFTPFGALNTNDNLYLILRQSFP